MIIKKIITVLIFHLLVASFLLADGTNSISSDTLTSNLDKIVVSASKSAKKVTDIPAAITIITKAEIASSPAKNIDDILQYAAGVQVKRPVGLAEGVPSDIIVRGIPGALTASRILILIDGIPTNVAGTPFLILNEIPIEAIQRVEIIKGPYSCMYGANALSGVINIITTKGYGKPECSISGESSLPFTAAYQYGKEERLYGRKFWSKAFEKSYWNGVVQSSGEHGKLNYLINGGIRTIGNYVQRDSALLHLVGRGDSLKSVENHDYTDYRLLAKGIYSVNEKVKVTTHFRFFKSELGFGFTDDEDSTPVVTEGQKVLFGNYITINPETNVMIQIGGFVRSVTGIYQDGVSDGVTTAPAQFDAETDDIQFEGHSSFRLGSKNTVVAGFDHLITHYDFGHFANKKTGAILPGLHSLEKKVTNTGLYLQDDFALVNWCHFVPALRIDHHSEYGTMYSPKAGLSVDMLNCFNAHVSAGKAFRAPSATELHFNLPMGDIVFMPNKDLVPEKLTAYDAGLRIRFPQKISVNSVFFYNTLKNLITLRAVLDQSNFSSKRKFITYQNISDAWSWGIENEISWKLFRACMVNVNYTFTRSEEEKLKTQLEYIPEHKGNISLLTEKKLGNFTFLGSVSENFVGKRIYFDWSNYQMIILNRNGMIVPGYKELDAYWKSDLSISCTYKEKYTFSVNIQNLFNADIEESAGTFAPGRFASIKTSVQF